MEAAYDHIQEEVLRTEGDDVEAGKAAGDHESLGTDLQDAYKTISASPWGVKLGGILGSVRKQGESYYQGARQEASVAGEEALKGFNELKSSLTSRARGLSLNSSSEESPTTRDGADAASHKTPRSAGAIAEEDDPNADSFISRFRAEAEKRLKDIQAAEDAADEALLKFGTNIRNFLRDAVTVAPPGETNTDGTAKVLFESKDAEGRRVIHTSRFDAQLHVIHCSLDSFTKDPASAEYARWKAESGFSVESKTADIASELEKYEELRRSMEKLVPEKVEYEQFWQRYYFLRMVVESEEKKRREVLKDAALSPNDEVRWDEDSDSSPSTPQATDAPAAASTPLASHRAKASSATGNNQAQAPATQLDPSRAAEPRTSQDQNSQAGSDASYDLVSRASSAREPSSPRDDTVKRKDPSNLAATVKEATQSDEEDWE